VTEFQVLYVGLEMQLGQREQEIHMKVWWGGEMATFKTKNVMAS
jgi:hypothetical protein